MAERPSASSATADRLRPRFSPNDAGEEQVFCVRFSHDGMFLATSHADGMIRLYATLTGKPISTLKPEQKMPMPTTMLRWHPGTPELFASVSADGRITHWNAGRRRILHEVVEPDNELFCCDYKADGTHLAVAGKQPEVHVYDELSKAKVVVMRAYADAAEGHSNRVFSLKYNPTNPEVIVTGSWDKRVQIFDARNGRVVRSFCGPHVCADAVDISKDGKTILTGSWTDTNQLQLWSFEDAKLIETFQCGTGDNPEDAKLKVYAAQFSKHDSSSMILAGGSGVDKAKLYDHKRDWAVLGTITCPAGWCQTVDFTVSGNMLAIGTSKGAVQVMDVN